MGISDDIVPRRVPRAHRHVHHRAHDIVREPIEEISRQEKMPDDRPEADMFFARPEKTQAVTQHEKIKVDTDQDQSKENGSLSKILFTIFFWIFLFAIIFGIAYKNMGTIKKIFLKNSDSTSSSTTSSKSSKSDTYVGEIQPQDYTSESSSSNSTSSTSSNTSAGTAVSSSASSKTAIKIQVLNGNGITNSASSIKKEIEKVGFTVSSLTNASNFNYSDTIIYYKSTKKTEAESIKNSITLKNATIEASETLTKTYDIVVVVGKK